MALIELDDVSLVFHLRALGRISLKEYIVRGLFRQQSSFEVHALEGINLRIDRGDHVGIIGHNGAGKSTLLKLIAGVYPPTAGKRHVEGRISSLFDISLGFEHEGTGWDNIRFRSYLQGETPRSVRAKMQPIAEFSELGEFLEMPVRYYSAGMMVRLAFSIATAIEPEILIVDEVFGAGDMAFQAKARGRIRSLMNKAQAVLFVSHDLVSVAQVCDKVIWLDHGRLKMVGPTATVIEAYTRQVQEAQRQAA